MRRERTPWVKPGTRELEDRWVEAVESLAGESRRVAGERERLEGCEQTVRLKYEVRLGTTAMTA